MSTTTIHRGANHATISAWLAVVLTLALFVRVGFACLVVSQHTSDSFADIHGDTAGYLRLGERVFDRQPYTAGSGYWRVRGLVRPPGYPTFYAAVRAAYQVVGVDLATDLRPIVWPQVAISLLQVAATFAIARVILRSVTMATIAGLLAACSPTGAATATIPMADAPFAACFAIAFLGLLLATRGWRSPWVTSGTGLALALAALLKPAAIYWPVVVVIALAIARGRTGWRTAVIDARRLVLPTLIVIATWTAFNAWSQGVPVYSIVSARNLRYEVASKVELIARLGRPPTNAEYVKFTTKTTKRDEYDARADNADLRLIYDRMIDETKATLRANPGIAARAMLTNLGSSLGSRYKLIRRQLHDGTGWCSYQIRRWVDETGEPWALAAWYGPMVVAPLLFLGDRRTLAGLALCGIGFAYVALPTASVGGEGSRLLLAGEPMAITLIVAMLSGIGRAVRSVLAARAAALAERGVSGARP